MSIRMFNRIASGTTKDYNSFKFMKYNRKINKYHVKKWEKRFKNTAVIGNPILVIQHKKMFYIFDGQHKFCALQNLGEEIPYSIIDMTLKEGKENVSGYQGGDKWKSENFLEQYIEEGNENYIKFYNYQQQSGLSLNHFMNLVDKSLKGEARPFKMGTFVMSKEFEQTIANRTIHYKDIISLNAGRIPILCNTTSFIVSVIRIVIQKSYCHKRMMYNLKKYASMLKCMTGNRKTKITDFVIQFNQIYNKGYRGTDVISFNKEP